MKKFLIAMAVVAIISAPVYATDVGVSVSIGQPGFYGQIDIGGFPRPVLLYPQPVVIERVPAGRPPVYLHVPPGHAKHWGKHCREYGACGEQVYFVRDDWYAREYVPRYQERRGDYRDHDRGQYRDNHRGDDRHDKRGHGHDKGRGRERDR